MAIRIPVSQPEQKIPVSQNIGIKTLRWSAKLAAFYFTTRFVVGIFTAMNSGIAGPLYTFLNILTPIFFLLFLIGIWEVSSLAAAKSNRLLQKSFSAGIVTGIFWLLMSSVLTAIYLTPDTLDKSLFFEQSGWRFFVAMWFCWLISAACSLFFTFILYKQRIIVDTTFIQLLVGIAGISINWIAFWPPALAYVAPLSFLALAGIGWSTGVAQIIVWIERGEDVVVSPIDERI